MCMIDMCDEPFAVHHSARRRSRRLRTCQECNTPIQPGKPYQAARGLYDGRWDTFTICAACYDGPCAWLIEQCGGFVYHAVFEDIEEHWNEERRGLDMDAAVDLGWHLIRMRRRRNDAGRDRLRELTGRAPEGADA